jgi:RNA polymerase sigma factor (sigma-70 family)
MIVSNPTEELAYYTADLQYVTHLSQEEQRVLIHAAAQKGPHLDREARNQFVEEYLAFAKHVAMKYCPFQFRYLLPDIIGEVNLALVLAADRYDVRLEGKFSTYLYTVVEGTVDEAINKRRIIRIPRSTFYGARQRGTTQPFLQLEPVSLDAQMEAEKKARAYAAVSLFPTGPALESDPTVRSQIESWLTHLSQRDETIVRMHYRLIDGDEHTYSEAEIAQALGVSWHTVRDTLTRSLIRLKNLAEGTARFREKDGRLLAKGCRKHTLPILTLEQETLLMQAAQDLCTQGIVISMRSLSKATGLYYLHTRAFLKEHRHELPQEYMSQTPEMHERRRQERVERITQAYIQLADQGKPISMTRLARAAHVDSRAAAVFLHTLEKEQEPVEM